MKKIRRYQTVAEAIIAQLVSPRPLPAELAVRQGEYQLEKRTLSRVEERNRDEDTRKRHLYNMSQEEYTHMLQKQGGVCAICSRSDGGKALSVDHCHTTGMIRGLLCARCNSMLGFAADNVETLQNAAAYLERSRDTYAAATPEMLERARQCPIR